MTLSTLVPLSGRQQGDIKTDDIVTDILFCHCDIVFCPALFVAVRWLSEQTWRPTEG